MPHQLLTISHHVAWITLHYPPANVLQPLRAQGAGARSE